MKISTVSNADYVLLVATNHYYKDYKEFGCDEKAASQMKYPDAELRIKMIKEENGCLTKVKNKYVIDGIGFDMCLCNYKHPSYSDLNFMVDMIDKGYLPDEGTYKSQAAHLIDYYRIITRMRIDQQNETNQKYMSGLK